MALNGPAAQLTRELDASIHLALEPRRPIIHRLNADSSWLLQIPQPETAIRRGSRVYYNIVIDPWFTGGQTDLVSWFSRQYHATPSAVQSFAELEDLIRGLEKLASAQSQMISGSSGDAVHGDNARTSSLIDVIAVSHEFTDHCHRDTLVEAQKDVPVLAFTQAAALIQSWGHFRTVIPVGCVSGDNQFDWRTTSLHPFLPEWLGICQLRQTEDPLNLHSALLVTFNNGHGKLQPSSTSEPGELGRSNARGRRSARFEILHSDDDNETAEALIYTPHGVHFADFKVISNAVPSICTLVFLHGLHDVRLGAATGRLKMQLNLGSHNGLKAQRILKAKYWVGTHDEVKRGSGLVSWFLQRNVLTIKDALEVERETQRKAQQTSIMDNEMGETLSSLDDTSFVALQNGESRVL